MFPMVWYVTSGHYRVPGTVPVMGTTYSFPICPPSTLIGALESLCGDERGAFKASGSQVAFGWAQRQDGSPGRPKGMSNLLRVDHVWSNNGVKVDANGHYDPDGKDTCENRRPTKHQTFYDLVYQVVVKGPYEARLRAALRGEHSRYGVVSLGESENGINWISEDKITPTEWLVPGNRLALPIEAPKEYKTIQPVYRGFALTPTQIDIPTPAWL